MLDRLRPWLPRVSIHGFCSAEADREYEGHSVELHWGPFLLEFAIAKVDRIICDPADDDEPSADDGTAANAR